MKNIWSRRKEKQGVDDHEAPETYITDSNVDITISNGETQKVDPQSKETDPWPILIIAAILIAVAIYGYLTRAKIL